MSDNHFLKQLPNEVTVYGELKQKFPEVREVSLSGLRLLRVHLLRLFDPSVSGATEKCDSGIAGKREASQDDGGCRRRHRYLR